MGHILTVFECDDLILWIFECGRGVPVPCISYRFDAFVYLSRADKLHRMPYGIFSPFLRSLSLSLALSQERACGFVDCGLNK